MNEFPSLMRDVQDRIYLVQPLLAGKHYMVCLGTFNDEKGASGDGFGDILTADSKAITKQFTHMAVGFFIEIEQTG